MATPTKGSLRVLRGAPVGDAALDTAYSRALLEAVEAGEAVESLRLYRPADSVAFSTSDRVRPGFRRAVEQSLSLGFEPVMRLAGGRAALFHRETLAFAWAIPSGTPRQGIAARFRDCADWIRRVCCGLGIDARVGAVPGEYCPGDYSVNARGRTKVMGVGQRVVRGAAHVGGVIVVGDSAKVRDTLLPIYRTLGYEMAGEAVGSLRDERGDLDRERVIEALLGDLAERLHLVDDDHWQAALDTRARALAAGHRLAV